MKVMGKGVEECWRQCVFEQPGCIVRFCFCFVGGANLLYGKIKSNVVRIFCI